MNNFPQARPLSLGLAFALCLQGASPAAWAGAADDLRDLVGTKGAAGETAMEDRGYTHIDTGKSATTAYSYWWSNSKKACVRVATRDGRYDAITDTEATDCGRTASSGGMSDGAKVAIGAAAILGVAALMHKSHDRNDRKYNERQAADFERGYRDGLYNHSYHNYDRSNEYSDGYQRGIEERNQNSSYRSSSWDRGGYQSYASVSDLNGRSSSHARRELEQRGFKLSGERDLSRDRYQLFYWNHRTNQCVDVHTRYDRVESVNETGRYACKD